MESRSKPLLIIALLCANAAASTTTLQPIGSSAPLRTLALSARAQATAAREPAPPLRIVAPAIDAGARVGAEAAAPQYTLPSGPGTPALPQLRAIGGSVHIEGLRAGDGGATGALGDLQYVQMADSLMAVYGKANGALQLGPIPANTMYFDAPADSVADACGAMRRGAAVHFDQLAKRWIVSHQAVAQGLHYQCIAVSTSADATGSYVRYALPMLGAAGQSRYFDDPQLAVWPDAYYISVNLFDSAAGRYRGPRICGIDRQSLLRGAAALMRCRDLGEMHAPVAPASLDGYAGAPEGASPMPFLALEIDGAGRGQRLLLWRFSFAANRLHAPLALPVAPFAIACAGGAACIAQPAPGGLLATAGERMTPRPVFRNDEEHGTLLATHAVTMPDGQLGVRWYEIREPLLAARVYQQGSFAPDSASRWMAGIGMDKTGNIALGYAVAAPDTPPGIRYTGRRRGDPPGRMQGEQFIIHGDGVQPGHAVQARASGALALDPIDGCTFWYTQHYLPSTGTANWRTRIASFKFETCH